MTEPDHAANSYIDALFANFDEKAAAKDVREAKARVAAGEAMLVAYGNWKAARSSLASKVLVGLAAGMIALGDAQQRQAENATTEPRTSRKAIASLIHSGADDTEWTIGTVAAALDLGEASHHAIGVHLSRLSRSTDADRIFRRRKGVYTKLPATAVTAAAAEGRETTLETGSREGPGWAGDQTFGAQVA